MNQIIFENKVIAEWRRMPFPVTYGSRLWVRGITYIIVGGAGNIVKVQLA